MVKFLILQIKLKKLTLEDIKEKYPQYYDDVVKELIKYESNNSVGIKRS